MTVSSTVSFIAFVSNGAQTAFPCSFKVFEEEHVQVYVDGVLQALTTDYTLSGIPGDSFTVNFVSAPANLAHISVVRVLPLTQETDYLENDEFPAESHERALDLLTMMVQQVAQDAGGKAVRFPATDPVALTGTLPAAADRAQKLLAFASNGEVVAVDGADLGAFSVGDLHTWTAQQIMQVAADADGWALQTLAGVTLAKFRHTTGGFGAVIVTDAAGNEGVIQGGAGSPEGVRGAVPSTLYLRSDGAPGTFLYVKETGSGNTGWKALGATEPASVALSGTGVTVPGVLPRTRKVTIYLNALSTSGTNNIGLRLGTSAGLATSGYNGVRTEVTSGGAVSAAGPSDRFVLGGTVAAANTGQFKIELTRAGENLWMVDARGFDSTARDFLVVGHITLAGALDRFQVLTGIADTFDAGTLSYVTE